MSDILNRPHVSHSAIHLSAYRNEIAEVTPEGVTFRHAGFPTVGNCIAPNAWARNYSYSFGFRHSTGRITVRDGRTGRVETLTMDGVTFPVGGEA